MAPLSQGFADETAERFKASLIYNCIQGMAWPKARAADTRWVIGIIGDDKVRSVLSKDLAGKTAKGKSFSVIEPSSDVRSCHVVFIAESARRVAPNISSQARENGILTIGETDDGFMIRIRFVNEAPRPSANVPRMKQAGLQPTADILRVLSK